MPIIYDDATEKVKSTYSFKFTIDGYARSAWYDPKKHDVCFDCDSDSDLGESLHEFLVDLTELIVRHEALSDIKSLDLEKFAVKHLKDSIKIEKVLLKMEEIELREFD